MMLWFSKRGAMHLSWYIISFCTQLSLYRRYEENVVFLVFHSGPFFIFGLRRNQIW